MIHRFLDIAYLYQTKKSPSSMRIPCISVIRGMLNAKQDNKIRLYKHIESYDLKGSIIMEEVKHPRMAEAIANAEKAAVSTRGIYPVTKASHVFKEDGTPLETPEEETEGE